MNPERPSFTPAFAGYAGRVPGRTLVVTRGEVHAHLRGERRLVALMQQTLMVMHGKADDAAREADA
jgi:hypothetical protein